MRCKKHPCQPSGPGVCPSCLRERLLDLLAAQAQEEALALPEKNHGDRRRETPLPFPRSVSPYVSSQSRRSARLFYSTPQLNPSGSVLSNRNSSYSKPRSRFSIFSSLFGKKDNDPVKDNDSVRVSWFSSLIRRKKSRLFSVDVSENATATATATAATVAARSSVEETRRKCGGRTDRGMSPVRKMRWEEEEELGFGSGYSSESSSRTRTTATPAKKLGFQEEKQRRIRVLQQRNQSGLMFCLSPLMRPSPNHRQHRHHHGELNGWDSSFSGEIRNSGNKYCSSNPSFCANRSRKLADFGRYP